MVITYDNCGEWATREEQKLKASRSAAIAWAELYTIVVTPVWGNKWFLNIYFWCRWWIKDFVEGGLLIIKSPKQTRIYAFYGLIKVWPKKKKGLNRRFLFGRLSKKPARDRYFRWPSEFGDALHILVRVYNPVDFSHSRKWGHVPYLASIVLLSLWLIFHFIWLKKNIRCVVRSFTPVENMFIALSILNQ